MKNLNTIIDIEGKALSEVLFFIIASQAKSIFNNQVNYRQLLKNFFEKADNNKSLSRLVHLFHIDKQIIRLLCPHTHMRVVKDGESKQIRIVDLLLNKAKESQLIQYIGKKDHKTKNGKRFSHLSFWILTDEGIKTAFEDKDSTYAQSKYYSKLAHSIIDQYVICKGGILAKLAEFNNAILKHKANKENKMTKAEKEQYEKEYAEGKHSLSLKDYLKFEAKKKRRADKHRMTIAKKAAKETLSDYVKLQTENAQLKAEIERLKQLKDLNSDIDNNDLEDGWLTKEEIASIKNKVKMEMLNDNVDYEQMRVMLTNPNIHQQLTNEINAFRKEVDEKEINENVDNNDIDESKALMQISTVKHKMLKIACEYYNANEKTVQFLAKHDFIPVDYSLSKYMVVENADRWIYSIRLKRWAKLDKNNQYSFGPFIDTVDKIKYAEMQDNANDLFFYADKFLEYIKHNHSADYISIKNKINNALNIHIK